MYKAIETFYDRELKRTYKKGEDYPGEGRDPDPGWIDKLFSGNNRVNRPVIEFTEIQRSQALNASEDFSESKESEAGTPQEAKRKPKQNPKEST